ncbi:MAG: hypothetical protein ACO2PN_16155 [Pyrobaculum sp.]|jgi:hypothetical protein
MEVWYELCCKKRKEKEERRRKEYEEWRRKNLGDCYANELDYSIGEIVTATIGEGIVDALNPGDKVLIALDTSADPCMKIDGYVKGYVPVYSEHCRCKRSEYDAYAIVQLPLYIRHSVLRERKYNIPPLSPEEKLSWFIYVKSLVVAEYKGDRVLEIVDTDDYDYYLHVAMVGITYDDPVYDVDVEGAVWHVVYYVAYSDTIYDQHKNRIAELDVCCYDEAWWYLIVLALIRRNEIAKIKYLDSGKERFEHIITAMLPPVVKQRRYDARREVQDP